MWRQVVSQSPTQVTDQEAVFRYRKAWSAINTLLEQGRSLSGHERHCCFLNTADGRFADISAASELDLLDDGRGVAVVDWDFDGRLDLWISNRTAPRIRFLRNHSETGHHFLAVKLQGRQCNRDAIGAGVVLHCGKEHPKRLSKTLRAGEGFLAQSSKWLHFGLGSEDQIERLVVRWPGGTEETFDGLKANQFYQLVQNEGRPQLWNPPKPTTPLTSSPSDLQRSTAGARTFMATRILLPEANYIDFNGRSVSLTQGQSGPRLINLWATWCRPCLDELQSWTEHAPQLDALGLKIVALSVDELGDDQAFDRGAAKQMLAKLRFPFDAGLATADLVGMLEMVGRALVDKRGPLPVPSSVLLDAQGHVAAIYKGPVEWDQLVADVQLLDASPTELRANAAHFPGRWFSEPPVKDPLPLVQNLLRAGQIDSAQRYLERYRSLHEALPHDPPHTGRNEDRYLGEAYYLLADTLRGQRKLDEAVQWYRLALTLNREQPRLHIDLGFALVRQGQPSEAIPQFQAALQLDAHDVTAKQSLVLALMNIGRYDEAIEYLRQLVESNPNDPTTRLYLARALQEVGRGAASVQEYRHALLLQPHSVEAINDLAWLLATFDDAEIRDATESLRLAKSAFSQATRFQAPAVLDTLAAAQAEAGRFDEAVQTVKQAIKLATSLRQSALVEQLQQRLHLYQAGKPYRHPRKET